MAAKDTGTDVAVLEKNNTLPAFSDEELASSGDLGYSQKADDTLVPILAILQDNSGEIKKGHAKRIDNAEAGFLIIRSFKKVIEVSKTDPLIVQPCGFTHVWVQWDGEPGEGKVVGQYPFEERPEEAVERTDPQNPDKKFWGMPDGTRIVDTRYHYCQALVDGSWIPLVIPMSGTNHTVSRQWTGQMKSIKLPNGAPAPAWFRQYAFSTAFNSRGAQSWYTYDVTDLGWIGDANLRAEGKKINSMIEELTPIVDEPVDNGAGDDESPV